MRSTILIVTSHLVAIGLDPIDKGDEIGWNICDGICWVDIQHTPIKSETGKTLYRLDYVFSPEAMDSYY